MKVWKLSTLAAYVTNSPHMDFALFAKNLESWLSKEDYPSFGMITWSIWHSRNIALYQNQKMDPKNVLCKAEAVLNSYTIAQGSPIQEFLVPPTKKGVSWIPPDNHWCKLNVDAAINIANGITGLGAIIRNFKGDFIAGSATRNPFLGHRVCRG
ncbi:hypothetical protein WN943_024666 [Citrus x changshan-huyou]